MSDNEHGDHGGIDVKPVIVTYNWEQFSEEDSSLGIGVILFYGVLASISLLAYILLHETE